MYSPKPSRKTKALTGVNLNGKGKLKRTTSIHTRRLVEHEGYIEELDEELVNFNHLTSPRKENMQ